MQQLLCRDKGKPGRGSSSPKLLPLASRSPCDGLQRSLLLPKAEPALPMSLLSPSCWPRKSGGDGFEARGCSGDVWAVLVLLLSGRQHCKLETPMAMRQLCTSTCSCVKKSSTLLSLGTGPYHHAQHFQQHPAHHHSCTGEFPSLWIRLTCTPPCTQHTPGRSWAMHQNMHRAGSLLAVSPWQCALSEKPLHPGLWGGREFLSVS